MGGGGGQSAGGQGWGLCPGRSLPRGAASELSSGLCALPCAAEKAARLRRPCPSGLDVQVRFRYRACPGPWGRLSAALEGGGRRSEAAGCGWRRTQSTQAPPPRAQCFLVSCWLVCFLGSLRLITSELLKGVGKRV